MTPREKKNAWMRMWRKTTPGQLVSQRSRKTAQHWRTIWLAELKNVSCMDCKHKYPPECMDFDHVRGRKLFEVNNRTVRAYSLDKLRREIKKCDLVCSNCHRIRTTRRLRA